jgi:tetratricopeptide (TPR) repeat protein
LARVKTSAEIDGNQKNPRKESIMFSSRTSRLRLPALTAAIALATVLILPSIARPQGDNPGATAWRRGMSLLDKELVDAAIAQFSLLVQYDPKDPVSYCYRANAFARKKDWQNMLADANAAIRLDNKLAWAYVLRGQACAGLKKHEEAEDALGQAIRLDPRFKEAYIQRGYLYAKLGQPDKASRDFSVANRLIIEEAGGESSGQLR